MPHKESVARLVDRCAPDATALASVNCVVPDGDDLVGENTDGPGFIDALRADLGFDPGGCRAVVLGAGGAGRAVVLALAREGASDVAVVNRTRANADRAVALAGQVGRVVGAGDAAMDATMGPAARGRHADFLRQQHRHALGGAAWDLAADCPRDFRVDAAVDSRRRQEAAQQATRRDVGDGVRATGLPAGRARQFPRAAGMVAWR